MQIEVRWSFFSTRAMKLNISYSQGGHKEGEGGGEFKYLANKFILTESFDYVLQSYR